MNTTQVKEWVLRIVGYGLSAVSGWIATKTGDPAIGACVSIAGTAITNKAIPYFIPSAAKVAAAQAMPKPLPFTPKALQR